MTMRFKGFIITTFLYLFYASASAQQTYPKITGYVGILHPIVTFGNDVPHYNFDGAYVVGMPTGINIWKSSRVGFSMEFVPTIRAIDGTSKMSNFLFHPGALFGLGHGFTLATRAAFETSGRYGFTPVLNKIVIKGKQCSMFMAVPVPARFGNDQAAAVGVGFQFGITF
ncbi:hypothetical protein MKQ68_11270 [Chitinophaga horti]|uniref:Outer membrane protein beta-barrel domain-containing protein n=1 Tax=Chitinophaga horti TaxID=2920382 RepID=A0ABY6J7V6_9BACT|nr:hypothetical protein [Chitinophaga horti]UYQ95682.1 hypothetical protein MKQ68_11270 [Chitinophaga horti]